MVCIDPLLVKYHYYREEPFPSFNSFTLLVTDTHTHTRIVGQHVVDQTAVIAVVTTTAYSIVWERRDTDVTFILCFKHTNTMKH